MTDEKTTTAIARRQEIPAIVAHFEAYKRYAMACVYAGIAGQGNEAQQCGRAMVAMQFGRELGIGPTSAIRGVTVIDGKPAPNAGLVGAIVKGSGVWDFIILQRDEKSCRLQFTKDGEPVADGLKGIVEFSYADATRAGLTGKTRSGKPSNYDKYPRRMLYARALTEGATTYCPHLFLGAIYTGEELGGPMDDGLIVDAVDIEPESEPDPQADREARMLATLRSRVIRPAEPPQDAPEPAPPQRDAEDPAPAEAPAESAEQDVSADIDDPTPAQIRRMDDLLDFATQLPKGKRIAAAITDALEVRLPKGGLTKAQAGALIGKAKAALGPYGWAEEEARLALKASDDPEPGEPPDKEVCDHPAFWDGSCTECGVVMQCPHDMVADGVCAKCGDKV